ncbi:hypothetical protein HY501_03230 [Candidatus Woesearchaeota archaeon]|nr:hypothetical protein [Candidatus Woesearchaeota archaeon]
MITIPEGLSRLELALNNSWSPETTNSWEPENPSRGQCAVTAVVINDFFSGEILCSDAILPDGKKESHYYNVINGEEVDLTRQQFPQGTVFTEGKKKLQSLKGNNYVEPFKTTREYILAFPKQGEGTKR